MATCDIYFIGFNVVHRLQYFFVVEVFRDCGVFVHYFVGRGDALLITAVKEVARISMHTYIWYNPPKYVYISL